MNGKPNKIKVSTPMLASIGAAVLVAVLFFSFLLSSGLLHERGAGIELPSEEEDAPQVSQGGLILTAQSVAEIDINTNNAQKVISTLIRPDAYSCRIENTLYFSGGSATRFCRRYARGQAVRTDTLNASGTVESTLLRANDTAYSWNAGDRSYYKGAWGDFSDDASAMLPTYEDVLQEGVKLQDAAKQDVDFEPCIRAAFEQDGYRCVYYISTASGLLKTASFYEGDTLVRQVTVSELQAGEPGEELFTLPGGQSVLGEE